jgi:hypothetical protein
MKKVLNCDNSLIGNIGNKVKVTDIVDYLERVKSAVISQQHVKMCEEIGQLEYDLEQSSNKINQMKQDEQDVEIELKRKRSQLEAINNSIADCQEHQTKLGEEVNKILNIIMSLNNIAPDEKLKELKDNIQTEQRSLQQNLHSLKNNLHSVPQVHTNIGPGETSSFILNISEALSGNGGNFTCLIKEIESKILDGGELENTDKPQEASATDKTVVHPQPLVEITEPEHPREEFASNIIEIEPLKESPEGTESNKLDNKQQDSNENQIKIQSSNATEEPTKEQPKEPLKTEEIQSSIMPQQTLSEKMEAESERIQKLRDQLINQLRHQGGASSDIMTPCNFDHTNTKF